MSHFTVLVVGEDPDKQLAPYHEFECTGRDDEYVQDVDITAEMMEKMAKGDSLEDALGWYGLEDKTVNELSELDKSKTHKYGYAIVRDGQLVKAVNRTNPNRKWDWYSVGGRWTGFFKLKNGADGVVGRPGLMTEEARVGYADQARKGDIDIKAMRDEAAQAAAEKFDKFEPAFRGQDFPSWSGLREKHAGNIDLARQEFREHPVVKALEKIDIWATHVSGELADYYCNGNREEFIERARRTAIQTFAILKDGKWYERGEMGWWGVVHDEKEKNVWEEEFARLINDLPDDTLLTIVDCHI